MEKYSPKGRAIAILWARIFKITINHLKPFKKFCTVYLVRSFTCVSPRFMLNNTNT